MAGRSGRVCPDIGPVRSHHDQFSDCELHVELELLEDVVISLPDRLLADGRLAVGRHEHAILGVESKRCVRKAAVQSVIVGRHNSSDRDLVFVPVEGRPFGLRQ
jgi:hypothetical protein